MQEKCKGEFPHGVLLKKYLSETNVKNICGNKFGSAQFLQHTRGRIHLKFLVWNSLK